ncbi:MAG: hypothetical protein R3F49_03805 [Planctomycetota bacterium]
MLQVRFACDGGGLVVVGVERQGLQATVPLHFIDGSSGADVALAVGARLAQLGVEVTGPADGGCSLFLDGLDAVRLLGDGGCRVGASAMDGSISALRITPLSVTAGDAVVSLGVVTASPHDLTRDFHQVVVPIAAEGGAPGAAARILDTLAKEGWAGERPGGSAWRPIRDKGGRDVVGLSASVDGSGWQISIEL